MTATRMPEVIPEPGLFARPDAAGSAPDSTRKELDEAVQALQSGKEAWVRLDLDERLVGVQCRPSLPNAAGMLLSAVRN